MLARKWSLESCSDACSPSRMWSEPVDARMDATTGLQMSQPFPRPKRSSRPEKVLISVAEMISKSSARDWLKCSHSALDCSTPSASSSCLSSGTHDPHDVPADVQDFSAPTSAHPSAMAHFRSPLVTLLHEQICAESGSAPTPKAAHSSDWAGAIRASGSPGSSLPTMGRKTPYDEASPTSTPPRRVLASSDRTSLAYVRFTA